MVKIKEVIINELYTLKNYLVLDDGRKVDIGKGDSPELIKFFGGYVETFQECFPNVQHNIPYSANPKSHLINKGSVVMDTMPFYKEVKNFEVKANVHYDNAGHHLIVSYEGFTATFDL